MKIWTRNQGTKSIVTKVILETFCTAHCIVWWTLLLTWSWFLYGHTITDTDLKWYSSSCFFKKFFKEHFVLISTNFIWEIELEIQRRFWNIFLSKLIDERLKKMRKELKSMELNKNMSWNMRPMRKSLSKALNAQTLLLVLFQTKFQSKFALKRHWHLDPVTFWTRWGNWAFLKKDHPQSYETEEN